MESLANISKLLPTLKKTNAPLKFRSERDELISKFSGKGIQVKDRKTKSYRDATVTEIAKVLLYCPTRDLYAFYQECSRANHFAKFFWWAVKGRKVDKSKLRPRSSVG